MVDSLVRSEPQHYQLERSKKMVESRFPNDWDSSLDKLAPFVAKLLFGKCPMFFFSGGFRESVDADDVPPLIKTSPHDEACVSDDDTTCALKPDDDDGFELDDDDDEIDCTRKQEGEAKSSQTPSCDMRTGSLTSDTTDDSSSTISSCADKERSGLHQTQQANEVPAHNPQLEFDIDDERGPEACETHLRDPSDHQMTRRKPPETDVVLPLESSSCSCDDGSVENFPETRQAIELEEEDLSNYMQLEELEGEGGETISKPLQSVKETRNGQDAKFDDEECDISIDIIGESQATSSKGELDATTQTRCQNLHEKCLDSQQERLGKSEAITPEGQKADGITGRNDDEGKEDGEDKAKVRLKARVIFPADFKLGRSCGSSLIRLESFSSKLSGSNACNVSVPKSVSSRASSIVSASRSVRSLPREIELFDIEEESNKSPCCMKKSTRRTRRKPSNSGHSEPDVQQVTSLAITDAHDRKGIFTGTFSRSLGVPHGFGRVEFDSGRQWFEGDFKHGEWMGHGRHSDSNGDFYKGSFFCGLKHGARVMKFADGRTFEGQFVQGQMVQGLMTYQDGSTYNGGWNGGLRHGHGHSIFHDNSVYVGEFREGEFSGFGKMLWMDGGYYEGEWEKGEMQGYGKEILPNGNLKHEGQWCKGQPIRNGLLGAL